MFSPHKSRKPMTVKNYPMLVLFILCFTFMACLSVWASYSAGLMSKARTTSSKSDRKTDVKAFSRGWNIQRTQFLITEHGSIFRSSIVELLQKGYVFFSSRIICKNKTNKISTWAEITVCQNKPFHCRAGRRLWYVVFGHCFSSPTGL